MIRNRRSVHVRSWFAKRQSQKAITGDQLLHQLGTASTRCNLTANLHPVCGCLVEEWTLLGTFPEECYSSVLPSFYVYFISNFKTALLHYTKASRLQCSDQEQGSWTLLAANTGVTTSCCCALSPNVLPPQHACCAAGAAASCDTLSPRRRQASAWIRRLAFLYPRIAHHLVLLWDLKWQNISKVL